MKDFWVMAAIIGRRDNRRRDAQKAVKKTL
jgi:hypothetical protein